MSDILANVCAFAFIGFICLIVILLPSSERKPRDDQEITHVNLKELREELRRRRP